MSYPGRTSGGLAETTREQYAWLLREYAVPYFDSRGCRLGDIGPKDVRAFIDHVCGLAPRKRKAGTQQLAPSTVRRILCPLKALLAEAYELELITSDPSKVRVVVQSERPTQAAPKAMTPDQMSAVLSEIPEGDRLLFVLLGWTGLRIGEALGLQWQDFEQTSDGPVLRIRRQAHAGKVKDRTKTVAGIRTVAVVPSLAKDLLRHRASSAYGRPADPMFPTSIGTHMDAHNLRRRVLRPAAERAALPWVTPHVFRHSLATMMRDRGYDAGIIARCLVTQTRRSRGGCTSTRPTRLASTTWTRWPTDSRCCADP